MITREGRLRIYCTNFKEIENYDEAVQSSEQYDLHHRKEVEILEDGTSIIRSKKELKEFDLYYHRPASELIFLKHTEHMRIHTTGKKSPMFRKKHSNETKAKMSAWQIGEKSPSWKGDLASDRAKYMRIYRQRKRESAIASQGTSGSGPRPA